MRRIAVGIAVIGLLVSCGSSKDKSSDTTRGSTTTPPSAPASPLHSASAIQAKLASKGIKCAGKPAKPKPFYGVQAKESVSCEVDGAPVQITIYATEGDRAKVQGFAASIACSTAKGKNSTYLTAGNWVMGATFTAKNAVAVNQKLADAVGTEPVPVKC